MSSQRNSNGYTHVFAGARLNCSIAGSCFQLQPNPNSNPNSDPNLSRKYYYLSVRMS